MMWIGRLLTGLRAGSSRSLWEDPEWVGAGTLEVSSPAYADTEPIPRMYAGPGAGDNVSPELNWTAIPQDARTTVIWFEDTDAPTRSPLVHTAAVLPATKTSLAHGELNTPPQQVRLVRATLGIRRYHGPGPIPGHGPHTYRLLVFALDIELSADQVSTMRSLRRAGRGHILARGMLTGTYER